MFTISNLILLIFLILGFLFNPDPSEGWVLYLGVPLFEAGCILWIYRSLFFAEAPEDQVDRLEQKVEELENSVANGLADGMFWNFMRNVSQIITTDYEGGHMPIEMKVEVTRDNTYISKLKTPVLAVILPGHLDMNLPVTSN